MFDAVLTSISLGLLATTSPCVLPLYPGFLAYLSGGQSTLAGKRSRYFLGFFVLAGVLTMMLALGLLIAALAVSVGRALSIVIPLANLLIITLGVLLLFDRNPFKKLPQIQIPLLSNPFVNAFIYGLLYGPIALPCSGPLLVSIFALSLTAGEAIGKLGTFMWFGLGFGLPLLFLSFVSAANQRGLIRLFTQHGRLINTAGGLLLIGIGAYGLASNWALITAFLAQ
ncbi:MAG TPA: cytochrome c biogenesis protein CcdA [Anaerolineae bacterium]|nr:cytochrome c biogenesis protein CcdA [Anaerolineae bacterium]